MENIISVSDLSFGYDSKRKVLENINFQLKKGESVGLVGANGVGKSTLLRILVGLNTGFQGDVMVNNIPLENLYFPKPFSCYHSQKKGRKLKLYSPSFCPFM